MVWFGGGDCIRLIGTGQYVCVICQIFVAVTEHIHVMILEKIITKFLLILNYLFGNIFGMTLTVNNEQLTHL